jgi:hypothetical protein
VRWAALSPNTKEQRQALYDRARKTLIEKLRDPTFSQADQRAESEALEAAIQRVETEAMRRTAPLPRPKQRQKAHAAPPASYQDRPPLIDPKNPLRIAAGALATALVLGAGWAAYQYWPRTLSDVRTIATARSVPVAAEQSDAKPDYVRLRQLVYFRTNQPGWDDHGRQVADLSLRGAAQYALRYNIGGWRPVRGAAWTTIIVFMVPILPRPGGPFPKGASNSSTRT